MGDWPAGHRLVVYAYPPKAPRSSFENIAPAIHFGEKGERYIDDGDD